MRSQFVGHPTRRRVLAGLSVAASASLLPSRLLAADAIGEVTELTGEATAERGAAPVALRVGADVMVRDLIKTGNRSFLAMRLGAETDMRLGEDAELLIDEYLLDIRGTFDLSNGAMVFDRPEAAPKTATTIRTVFGQIGVRGTRFFAGPSNGVFGVFVERGAVRVTAAGTTQDLSPGEGVDIAAPSAPASEVARWSDERIAAAFASVEPG